MRSVNILRTILALGICMTQVQCTLMACWFNHNSLNQRGRPIPLLRMCLWLDLGAVSEASENRFQAGFLPDGWRLALAGRHPNLSGEA
jgi:hypothetical protein